jgi:hypothetical protein
MAITVYDNDAIASATIIKYVLCCHGKQQSLEYEKVRVTIHGGEEMQQSQF